MNPAVRVLLEGAVDYAGLFPPAGLDMHHAVANYAEYRASPDAWALGRFVLPVARLGEFVEGRRALGGGAGEPWPLSALVAGDVGGGAREITRFNAVHGDLAVVDCLEARLDDAAAITRQAPLAPEGATLFVEIPIGSDPAPLIGAIADARVGAKVRTGGVTASAFPAPAQVARFLRRCVQRGVPFKATAGLHHPLRGSYRLTYDEDAATAAMYGYLNVMVATAVLRDGGSDADAVAILTEDDPRAFAPDANGIRWRGRAVALDDLRRARVAAITSFGSCSFREPLDDLGPLGLAGDPA